MSSYLIDILGFSFDNGRFAIIFAIRQSLALRDRITPFPLPIIPGDPEPIVDLQPLVNELYDQLRYVYFIDYNNSPPLPWIEDDVVFWTGLQK